MPGSRVGMELAELEHRQGLQGSSLMIDGKYADTYSFIYRSRRVSIAADIIRKTKYSQVMKPTPFTHRGLRSLQSGICISFFTLAFSSLAMAQSNTKTGSGAGAKITTGVNNTANGFKALGSDISGSFNTSVGSFSMAFSNGSNNTSVGFQSLFRNKSGNFNTALGDGALLNNLSGNFNIAVGEDAGFRVKTGSNNIHIGNKGLATDAGQVRIGTPGIHKNTFLAGVIRGNGAGLSNISIPSSKITGKIAGSQIAPNAISSSVLAPNLVLPGNTTGTFTGSLTGNADTATTATNAAGLLGPNLKLSSAAVGSFGDTTGFQFNGGSAGMLLETNISSESAGIFLNGNTAVIYSPGDEDILRVFDEDLMDDVTPVPGFKVLNGTTGISTPGTATAGFFSGNGASLTNLNASNITSGTISDNRLSSNIPLKNGANVFTVTGNNSATISGAGLGDVPTQLPGQHVVLIQSTQDFASSVLALKSGDANPSSADNFITFYNSASVAMGAIDAVNNTTVAYKTTGADFAEVLPVADSAKPQVPAEIVPVHAGEIGDWVKADHFMVISDQAGFIGNDPGRDVEAKGRHHRIAFLGQVPVKVHGTVNPGDYIVASEKNDGTGIAKAAQDVEVGQMNRVVGRAWEGSGEEGLKTVNTAVGLDQTSLVVPALKRLERENQELRERLEKLEARLVEPAAVVNNALNR
jgi:hypothetical protein